MDREGNLSIWALEEEKTKLAEEAKDTGNWEGYDKIAQKILLLKEKILVAEA